jgi:hypothetical protein
MISAAGKTIGYRHGHNSVTEVTFHISRDLSQPPIPLHRQITPDDLRDLVEKNSTATLQELCELVQKQCGIKLSTTAMCRLIKRHSLYRLRKSQASSLALVPEDNKDRLERFVRVP